MKPKDGTLNSWRRQRRILSECAAARRAAPSPYRRRTLRALLVGALAAALLGPFAHTQPAAAATPTTICPANVANPQNAVTCRVSDIHSRYYWAYLETRVGPATDPYQGKVWVRVQVLARRGATSLVIMGMWLVYVEGPRQALSPAFDAVDGNGGDQNGSWNYGGGYSPDAAARGNSANPTRWPGVSPSNPQGLPWGRNGYANLQFRYQMWNGDHRDTFYTPVRSATIVFRP